MMSRRKRSRPEHRSRHELRLWAIVDRLVTGASEKRADVSLAPAGAVHSRFPSGSVCDAGRVSLPNPARAD
jgi:hypothetical protein